MECSRRRSLKTLTAAAVALPLAGEASGEVQPKGIRFIVLDVGGTLLEDRGDVVGALQSSLARRDIKASAEEIAPLRGASKRFVIRHFIDRQSKQSDAAKQALAGEIYKDFSTQVVEAYRAVPPVKGTEQALEKLRGLGYLLATTTGFDRDIVVPIFQRLGWEKYFAAIVASDDVLQGRPYPYMLFHAMETAGVASVQEVMAVGDTPLDLQAAANAGLRGMVGVLSGVGTEQQLLREPHTHIVQSVANLPALLGPKT